MLKDKICTCIVILFAFCALAGNESAHRSEEQISLGTIYFSLPFGMTGLEVLRYRTGYFQISIADGMIGYDMNQKRSDYHASSYYGPDFAISLLSVGLRYVLKESTEIGLFTAPLSYSRLLLYSKGPDGGTWEDDVEGYLMTKIYLRAKLPRVYFEVGLHTTLLSRMKEAERPWHSDILIIDNIFGRTPLCGIYAGVAL